MNTIYGRSSSDSRLTCFLSSYLIGAVWLAGFLLGGFFLPYAGDSYLLLMRSAVSSPVSIVGLFSGVLLPFLISAFAVYLSMPLVLACTCFLKAFSFSVCAGAVFSAFGSAGWLILILMQFSDCCMLPVMVWFSCRHWKTGRRNLRRDLTAVLFSAVAVGIMDYCIVSPYLVMLIDM